MKQMMSTHHALKSECKHTTPAAFLLTPNSYLLFPIWFACFWALIGTAWRPPLASAGLLLFFLVLIVAIEWFPRRFASKKRLRSAVQNAEFTEMLDESVRQQIIRSKTAEGLDRIDGTFIAEFPVDAMTATVHIPFCPAFERVPNVQVFSLDETDAALRITSSKTFGMRIDVKRNDTTHNRLRFAIIAEG